MAHRSLQSLVFSGLVPTTAATVISLLGDDGLPSDIRIDENLMYHPWQASRSGLLVLGMDPATDLAKVSSFIQNRTTWWEVAVMLADSINSYGPALLAQGAVKVLPHPEDDLTSSNTELRNLLSILTVHGTDILGLELSDLIQLYGDKRVPKTIRISGDGIIGSLYLRDGNVVHCETMDDMHGMDAFARLLAIRSPDIRVHNGCLTSKSTVNKPAMSVLLEGARVNDEGGRGAFDFESTDSEVASHALDALLDDMDEIGNSRIKGPKLPVPQPHVQGLEDLDEDFDLD